ncbi:MAG: ATP-binding protein [Nitrososphaeria archaeon]|nr:ATP-binding protein [Nitrososphaeria archaeon]
MDLEVYNPWWKGREGIEEDEDYRRWNSSKVKWEPPLLRMLLERENIEPFSLHFIFGPRQVGKTTLLKLLIKKLLETVNPKSIFYLKCDILADYKELDEAIREYLKIKKFESIEKAYIFLDEITFPREWFRAVKWNIDMGNFKNDILYLTGSLSMFVKEEIETFPGRRGKGKDFIMYPLSFREFVQVIDDNIIRSIGELESLDMNEVRSKCFKARPWLNRLEELFELYLNSGGFPLSIRSILESGKIGQDVINTYLSWIKGDIVRLKRNESLTKRVIKAVIEKVPSTISYHNIAREFEIKSHRTVFQHLDVLEKLFLVKVLHYIDPNEAVEVFYKQKKVHVTDPFLYSILSSWCLTRKPEDSVIVESIVASHLSRRYNIGYWKNSKEIDVVAFENKHLIGIEIKYRKRVEGSRTKIGKIDYTITLSKDQYNDEPLIVPVSVLLALLNTS